LQARLRRNPAGVGGVARRGRGGDLLGHGDRGRTPRRRRLRAGGRMRRALITGVLGLAAGCVTPEQGLSAARSKLEAGRLSAALLELDGVPPWHPDYAEARTLAQAVERRMRAGS